MKSALKPANNNTATGRTGRPAKDGMELYVPGLRSVIENKPMTLYYKKKLAEKGFIGLIGFRAPGTRGRPELRPIITVKGLRYFEKHQKKVPGYLTTETAPSEDSKAA